MLSILKNTSRNLSRLWNRQTLVFFFFLILSTAFWFFTVGKETKEVDFEVKIELIDVPDDIVITTPPPTTVTIRLRDNIFTLLRYKYIDKGIFNTKVKWSDIVGKDTHIVKPTAEVLKAVTSQLSRTTTIVNRRPDTYELYYNNGQQKVVSTTFEGTVNAANDYSILSTELSPAQVTIYAAPEILENITTIATKPREFNGCNETLVYNVDFAAPPGVKVVPEKGQFTIVADRYVEKTVQVPVRAINCPPNTTLRTFPSKVDVVFQVGSTHYQSITAESFDIVIDYRKLHDILTTPDASGLPSGEALKYILTLSNEPAGVRFARITPPEVECIIEHE